MDTNNNLVLNRLFTRNVFFDLVTKKDNQTYFSVIKRYLPSVEPGDNGHMISFIYSIMSTNYRNEYIYKNSLLNELLIKNHDVKTTTALTEIPIGKSKADFVLINGKATVYEIKTDLDNLDRLEHQINDYYRAFSQVSVLTSGNQIEKVTNYLPNKNIGICLLNQENKVEVVRKPFEDFSQLDYKVIFKLLHKREFENILSTYFGALPSASQVFYYDECYKQLRNIPILELYCLVLQELKKRNKIIIEEFEKVPYELKYLVYFSKYTKEEYVGLHHFLSGTYKG